MNLKDIETIFSVMIEKDISDAFIRVGSPLKGRIRNDIESISEEKFGMDDVDEVVRSLTRGKDINTFLEQKSYEFSYWFKDFWRFRVGMFYQRNTTALVIRKIDLKIPSFEALNLPAAVLEKFCHERRGLILLTGVTGSGKSTTIASMIEYMNQNFKRHVLTIEEPIEFTFSDKKSIVNQRELGIDVDSYTDALKQFTMHSPDVIFIGNIRDAETCHAALTAAETGVLVLSTLHTVNAASTIERMVNFFPPHQHAFVLEQLSLLLRGVMSQRLVPRCDSAHLIPVCETMVLSPTISRLLHENKLWEIPKYIASGDIYGMRSFHQSLSDLVGSGKILPQTALEYADKKEELEMELRNKGLI